MTGRCPTCGREVSVPGGRGAKVGDRSCEDCGVPLQGVTKGRSQGLYRCPIAGCLVTLGLRAVSLDGPYRLVFHPGLEFAGGPGEYHRDAPWDGEQVCLDRVAGRVLGTGCVVKDDYNPKPDDPRGWKARWRDERAGLLLVSAAEPGDPGTWLVNAKLRRRKCAACGALTPVEQHTVMASAWRPRRTWAPLRGRRGSKDLAPGPYPAGTIACPHCAPAR